MSNSKGVIALGFLVGVAVVAGILRIKFYFNPPEDRFTNRVNEILTTALTEPVVVEDEPATVVSNTAKVVPTVQTSAAYVSGVTTNLGEGILLSLLPESAGASAVVLRGSELMLQRYDSTWQLIPDSVQTIQSDVQLIAGSPPIAKLFSATDGYYLVLTQGQTDTQSVLLLQLATDGTVQTDTTLLTNLSPLVEIITTVTSNAVWVSVADGSLYRFALTDGSLQAMEEFSWVDARVRVCALIPDETNLIVVSENATELVFAKQTEFGVNTQSVSIPRPDLLVACDQIVRQQERLVIQLQDRIVPYSDNLSDQYPELRLTGSELYPFAVLSSTGLWLASSTSSTLGQYTMQVQEYVTPVAAE
ncbi:MAG: hypothetical protein HY565_02505 [Candidatus Kerfeldbacteria bacterium]|nr:hypothetical protein [Candidatus Kerfeldbacteria bacterium]